MIEDQDNDRRARWASEAKFFDERAEKAAENLEPIRANTLQRYRHPGALYHKEYRLRLLGDLTDRLVLDVGCGNGQNAVLLARLGARVVGIDISPLAIDVAERYAAVSGVKDRCRFICSAVETTSNLGGPFDIVWGDAILHHLIPELPNVLQSLTAQTRDSGVLVFSEPVNFCHSLRLMRKMVPVRTDATPDERPLEAAEVAVIRSFIPDLKVVPFHLFGRLHRFLLMKGSYEDSHFIRRSVSRGIASLDKMLFVIPGVPRLAGYAVLYGHPKSAGAKTFG